MKGPSLTLSGHVPWGAHGAALHERYGAKVSGVTRESLLSTRPASCYDLFLRGCLAHCRLGGTNVDATVLVSELASARMDGDIVDRDHAGYDKLRRVWNAMADRRPAVIVRARSVSDVEKVVAAAAKHGALLAIRGGGHSLPGLSTCDDGIMLDLSLMNAVAVDKPADRVEVLGGALLGDLDKASAPTALVVPAGVVSHTGVAGLTLGGGQPAIRADDRQSAVGGYCHRRWTVASDQLQYRTRSLLGHPGRRREFRRRHQVRVPNASARSGACR